MNISNLPPRMDYGLKRSFISQTYHGQNMQNTQNRVSTTKRSSFTGAQEYSSNTEQPRTPKAGSSMIFPVENFPPPGHYYHQNNYVNHHQYSIQPLHPQPPMYHQNHQNMPSRLDVSANKFQQTANKIEAFTLEQKKIKQQTMEEKLKQITLKLQKTITQVQKHEQLLKNNDNPYSLQLNSQSIGKIIQEAIEEQQRVKQIQNIMHMNLIKNEIETIKLNMHSLADRNEVEERITKVGNNINKTLEVVNKQLMQYLHNMTDMQNKNRRKQLQKIKFDLEYQIGSIQRNLQQKSKKDKEQYQKLTECSSYDTLPTRKVFIGDPLLLKIATKVSVLLKSTVKQIQQQEMVYKVDYDGYLLDAEGKYIVNSKYEQIRLTSEQIELIRQNGLLK